MPRPPLAISVLVLALLFMPLVHAQTYRCNPGFTENAQNIQDNQCCMWIADVDEPLKRYGKCTLVVGGVINFGSRLITSIPIDAFDNCGSPEAILLGTNKLTSIADVKFPDQLMNLTLGGNQITSLARAKFPNSLKYLTLDGNKITTLSDVNFPDSLMLLTLNNNAITSISGMKFPASLTRLDLNFNKIKSISGETITLKTCSSNDPTCTLPSGAARYVGFKSNLLTSIVGVKFAGSIMTLDLTQNPLSVLPNATFPTSLTELLFDQPSAPRWFSVPRCSAGHTDTWQADGKFNPAMCCMWGGNYAGAPLQRMGTCSTVGGIISFKPSNSSLRFSALPYNVNQSQGITAIPSNAFADCGTPEILEIINQPLQSLQNVFFPSSLRILDLGDNQLTSIIGIFPPVRFLYLGNNQLKSLAEVTFPVNTLTFLDISRNRIQSLVGKTFKFIGCSLDDNTLSLSSACTNQQIPKKTLNLENNLITSVANVDWSGIEKLNLNFNRISSLAVVTFPAELTTLSLNKNKISTFQNMPTLPASLKTLSLEENMISTLTGLVFSTPTSILDLDLSQNKIKSLAGVTFPSTLQTLDLGSNDLVALDFEINTVQSQMNSLTLPGSLQCISSDNLRTWVNKTLYLQPNPRSELYPDCKWSVVRCSSSAQCCFWNGSYTGAPLNRTGSCPGTGDPMIDLSNRGITAIPPGSFDDCGHPQSLKLNHNRIASLTQADKRGVKFPESLTHLDLSNNAITSLAGVSFNLTNWFNCTTAILNCEDKLPELAANRKYLNLANNLLTSLDGVTFNTTSMNLNLGTNKIQLLAGAVFPRSTRRLDLSNNQISNLDKVTFNFTDCEVLNLNNNEITSFSGAKFVGSIVDLSMDNINKNGITSFAGVTFDLKNCVELDLQRNRITSIEGASFSGSIGMIKFQNNEITSLAGVTFDTTNCTVLNLGYNEITSLEGAKFRGWIRTIYLDYNEIKSLAGATFTGSIAKLDMKHNQITSLAGVAFDFFKCGESLSTDNCTALNLAENSNFPLLDLSNNQITSLAGAKFAGSIKTLSLDNNLITSLAGATFDGAIGLMDLTANKITSLIGIETFTGIDILKLAASASPGLKILPSGLKDVTLPHQSSLKSISGLVVQCVPSPILRSRLSVDFGYTSFGLCAPIFWTRCDTDADVDERCPPPSSPQPISVSPPSAWDPKDVGCVPTNTLQCCIWSQAFPGAPLVREGACDNAVGGGIDFSGTVSAPGITAIPPDAFDNVGSPKYLNLEQNEIASLAGVKIPQTLQALFLNDNKITSLADVIFPPTLQFLHLHDNAGLTCVPMPNALVGSPMYSGPEACKIATTPPPSKSPATTARPPSPPSTTPSPQPPLPLVTKTDNFVQLVVALPYSKASFDQDKQLKFRTALAASAGTTAENVEILSITEGRRRQGQGIKVENKIYAKDAASAEKLSSTLGTGSGALDKINSELQKQGLEKSTGLDVVSANKSDNTGLIVGLVVGLGGGAIIIVAIAAYYLYVVKPAAQLPPKSRDLENAPVVAPSAPIVAPAASLGVPSPARMPAPSTLVFDAYDFTNWSKSGAPGYQTNQPLSNQPQYGAMPRFNM